MFTSGGKMLSADETARLLRLTGKDRDRFIGELVDLMQRQEATRQQAQQKAKVANANQDS